MNQWVLMLLIFPGFIIARIADHYFDFPKPYIQNGIGAVVLFTIAIDIIAKAINKGCLIC